MVLVLVIIYLFCWSSKTFEFANVLVKTVESNSILLRERHFHTHAYENYTSHMQALVITTYGFAVYKSREELQLSISLA